MAKVPKPKPQTDIPIGASYEFPLPPEKKESDYLEAYETWVYSAVAKISREVSMIDLQLYKKKYVGNKVEVQEVLEHESLSLLYEVNPFYTKQMFLEITQTYLDLTGEAAWAILRNNGKPVQLWPLRPDWISIKPSKDEYIDCYFYKPGGVMSSYLNVGQGVKILKEDLIFFKYPNPVNPYRGKGAVQAGAMAIDIDTYSDKWNRTFFFNAALPSLIFTTDQKMNEPQIKRFMEMWRSKFEGSDNAHKVAFLGGGMKIQPVGGNVRDLDFLTGKKYVRDEILSMFHVSKANLGVVEDVNRANQEATDARFAKDVIKPRMTALVSYLNEFYLSQWGDDSLFFDYKDPTPEDVEMKLRIYKSGLGGDGGAPWMTINEVRELENLLPAENGDIILLPSGLKPEIEGEEPNEEEEQEEGQEENEEEEKGFFQKLFKRKSKPKKFILKVAKKSKQQKIIEKLTLPIPPKKLRQLKKDLIKKQIKSDLVGLIMNLMKVKEPKLNGRDEFWKAMIAKTDIEEQKMTDKIKYLWDEQESLIKSKINSNGKNLDKIKYKTLRLKKLNDFFYDIEAENKKWISIFASFIKEIVEEKSREIFDFLGLGRQLNTSTVAAIVFLQDKGLEFIESVNKTTIQNLKNTLSEGLAKGEGIPELSMRVQGEYENWDISRAKMIARTEVLRATNFATDESYRQSEIVKGKEWLTALDERTCDECNRLDGKIVGLTSDFSSGVSYPPLHPNCRCTTIPVMNERLIQNQWSKPKPEVKEIKNDEVTEEETLEGIQAKEEEMKKEVKSKLSKMRTTMRKKIYDR